MSRKKLIIASVLLISAAGAIGCGYRHHAHDHHHAKKFMNHRVDSMLAQVDATDAQKKKIHGIKDQLFVDFEAAHAGSTEAKETLLAEWKSESPNRAKLHQLADARLAAYQKALHQTIDGMVEVHATLDKKQRAEITSHLERHMQR